MEDLTTLPKKDKPFLLTPSVLLRGIKEATISRLQMEDSFLLNLEPPTSQDIVPEVEISVGLSTYLRAISKSLENLTEKPELCMLKDNLKGKQTLTMNPEIQEEVQLQEVL